MPASWPTAALEAQVVATRTYAAHQRANQAPGTPYDTCDRRAARSTEVWRATRQPARRSHENARSTAAVASTAGLGLFANEVSRSDRVRVLERRPYREDRAAVPGVVGGPLRRSRRASTSRWTKTLPISAIEGVPTIGKLKALRIDKRDGIDAWGGRIITMTVIGSAGSKTVERTAFSAALGLRSTWWTVS